MGKCSVTKYNIKRNIQSVMLGVEQLVQDTDVYDLMQNHDPDGESNGSEIVI